MSSSGIISILFRNSEPGVFYDPSDLTTMFQDTAGTTPVTTPGQTVALLLDKSKGLVLGPELMTNGDFSNGGTGWYTTGTLPNITFSGGVANYTTSTGNRWLGQTDKLVVGRSYQVTATVSVSAGQIGPDVSGYSANVTSSGTYTWRLVASITQAQFLANSNFVGTIDNISFRELAGNLAIQATAASRPTYGIVPLGGRRNLILATDTMATQSLTVAAVAHTLSFTGTGTVTLTGASTAGPLVGTGASNRVSLTFTPTAASLTLTVAGSVTLAQLELGSTATAYQRVTTQYDVTETGVQSLSYLSFDGVDDGMVTGTITPGTDKAQVFAGFRRLDSTNSLKVLVELSAATASNNGSFYLSVPEDSGPIPYSGLGAYLRGTGTMSRYGTLSYPTNSSYIETLLFDLSQTTGATAITPRVNGVSGYQNSVSGGTSTATAFGDYPLYIGRRGGTANPFNGQIYSMIVRFGANLTTTQITNTERYVNKKTGAY
jgi:hypothetical protein